MSKLLCEKRKRSKRAAQIRHAHRTAAGLEDALAVLLDVQIEVDILTNRVNRALTILREVRAGPHSYNPEQPAGLRITVRSRR